MTPEALNVVSALVGAFISQLFNFLTNKRDLENLKVELATQKERHKEEIEALKKELEDWKARYFTLMDSMITPRPVEK